MRISDWSSDVCSSDLEEAEEGDARDRERDVRGPHRHPIGPADHKAGDAPEREFDETRRPARAREGDGEPCDDESERERPRDRDRTPRAADHADRQSVVKGNKVTYTLNFRGRSNIKKKKKK